MRIRTIQTIPSVFWHIFVALAVCGGSYATQAAAPQRPKAVSQDAMDRDLLEVTVPQLQEMYRNHKYTVTQVVRWYLGRIARYNGIYRRADRG